MARTSHTITAFIDTGSEYVIAEGEQSRQLRVIDKASNTVIVRLLLQLIVKVHGGQMKSIFSLPLSLMAEDLRD
ncbi:hypothetical protein P4S64_09125 [Vibrio sp. M60_M31a]